MSKFTYDNLLGQKQTLTNVIDQEKGKKADIETKISRLKTAIESLEKNISGVKDTKSSFSKVSIDESSWRGTEKGKFDEQFGSLKKHTEDYLTKSEDAKTAIEDELGRCEANLLDVEASISRFESSLSDVQTEMNERTGAR